jgi:hypothetical protein
LPTPADGSLALADFLDLCRQLRGSSLTAVRSGWSVVVVRTGSKSLLTAWLGPRKQPVRANVTQLEPITKPGRP